MGAFFAAARSLQIGNAIAVIAATASAANVVGILGGIVLFGDQVGSDPLTVVGRFGAFALVVFAVALVPAPVRAHRAVQEDSSQSESPPAKAEASPTRAPRGLVDATGR